MSKWIACAIAIAILLLAISQSRGPAVLPGFNNLPSTTHG
jgi:hypothetical protein